MENQSPLDLRESYFNSLRDEIRNTRSRIFTSLVIGIIGAPILTYYALQENTNAIVLLLSPFMILLVLLLYLSEQASMMQAGRFIKEQVEGEGIGNWEHWLTERRKHKPEPQLFGTVAIIFIIYYVILVGSAVQRIMHMKPQIATIWIDLYMRYFWRYGLPILYILGTFWLILTLLRFWRTALRT